MRDVLALILSGGGGEQLGVLSAERAVSALPFGGKYRVIDFVLSNCCHSGIQRVGVVAQHSPASLNDHIGAGRAWDLDRRQGGVTILQPYQTRQHTGWYRGTADAIAKNWDWIEEHRPERVLVLSGDHVVRMDYRPLVAAHLQRDAAITVAVTQVPADEAHRFGMVHVERSGRIKSIEEKPQRTDAALANMGIYLFETERLAEVLRTRPVDMVLDVIGPQVAAGQRVYAHEFDGYWEDIGTLASYYRANLELLRPHPRLVLHDLRWPILTRDEERPPVWVGDDAVVEDSLVANGCRVEGRVQRSILFPGVHVGPGATVTDSIVMADTRIEARARIEHSILDKYVKVGTDAVIGEPGATTGHDWLAGLAVVGKDTWLPEHGRVQRPSMIGVGGRYEDLAEGVLPAGSVVRNRRWFEEMR
ncbi:MAG: glucose-phosphate adenylyltransferase [Candidatus Eisenbacteria bacterium]